MRGMLVAVALVAACGKSGPNPEPTRKRRLLVPDAELDAMKAAHARAIEGNKTRACKRPVLRGDAIDGPADEDILAIEKRADVCLGALSYRSDAIDKALFLGPDDGPFDETEHRVRPLKASESQLESVTQLDAACDQLLPALHDAVSHEDACSPYLRGRGGAAGDLIWYLRLARPVLVRARLFARTGREVGAARILLDYLRLGQDLHRGGASVIEEMAATGGMRLVFDQLQQLVYHHLNRDGLTAVAAELAQLEASEPGLPELFRALPVDFAASEVVPNLEDADEDDETGLVLSWLAMIQLADALAAECGDGATDRACVSAYQALMVERANTARPDRATLLESELTEVAPELRKQVVEVFQTTLLEAHWKYVQRIAWRRAALVGLRWHAEARIAFARKQPCRGPDDLGVSTLGEALHVGGEELNPVLRAPAWTDDGRDPPTRYLLTVNCALRPPK